jgi:hypothetical protein
MTADRRANSKDQSTTLKEMSDRCRIVEVRSGRVALNNSGCCP